MENLNTPYKIERAPNGTITLHPSEQKHEFTLIFIHGLGQSAEKMMKHFENGMFAPHNCRIVLPTAESRPNTKLGGKVVPSWYDVYVIDWFKKNTHEEIITRHNVPEINESADQILALIESERCLLPNNDPKRIIIGGFSQGCIISLAVFLKYD